MAENVDKGTSKQIFTGKSNALVRQDKNAQRRTFPSLPHPSGTQPPAHVPSPKHHEASKFHGSNRRKTVEVYGCVSRETAAEIERLRNQGGKRLSRSAVVAALLDKAVQSQIDMQYGALLTPIIERAINARLRAR